VLVSELQPKAKNWYFALCNFPSSFLLYSPAFY